MTSNPPTILIAEDSSDIREILRRLLQRNGYQVIEATNGREALDAIVAQQPQLILLDLSMPLLDGWGTLTAIRALPGGEQFPVVAITAHAMAGDREAVLAHGFDAYVSKPIDMRAFLETVARLLKRA